MTRLWTDEAPQPDADLNAELADLAQALAPLLGKPVVFHDAGGAFAPVVQDPAHAHVFLHASPRLASNRAKAPNTRPTQTRHFPGDSLSGPNAPLPRLSVCRSGELDSVASLANGGGRDTKLLQRKDDTLFLLVRPTLAATMDGAIDPMITLDVLGHLLLAASPALSGAFRTHRFKPSDFDNGTLEEVERALPEAARLTALIRRSAMAQRLHALVTDTDIDPAGHLRADLERLQNDRRTQQDTLRQHRTALDAYRAKRIEQPIFGGVDKMTEIFQAKLADIRAMPQVRAVDAVYEHGNTYMRLFIAPLALGLDQRRSPDVATLAPIEARVCLTPGSAHRGQLRLRDIFDSGAPHPHVRHSTCLGTLAEPLRQTLDTGDLFGAAQLVIAYLQTYNVGDQWGRVGAYWSAWNAEIEHGSTVRCPVPEIMDAQGSDAQSAATNAEDDACGAAAPAAERAEAA